MRYNATDFTRGFGDVWRGVEKGDGDLQDSFNVCGECVENDGRFPMEEEWEEEDY